MAILVINPMCLQVAVVYLSTRQDQMLPESATSILEGVTYTPTSLDLRPLDADECMLTKMVFRSVTEPKVQTRLLSPI